MPFTKALYGCAYRLTRNADDAQDLVQETLLRAFAGFDRFRPGTNLRAWLFTILHRTRTDRLRRRGRRPVEVALEDEGSGAAPTQERRLVARDEVERALVGLPEAYRMAVVLRDIEELSYQEIAAILMIAPGTVMSRIHRGRGLLREALMRRTP